MRIDAYIFIAAVMIISYLISEKIIYVFNIHFNALNKYLRILVNVFFRIFFYFVISERLIFFIQPFVRLQFSENMRSIYLMENSARMIIPLVLFQVVLEAFSIKMKKWKLNLAALAIIISSLVIFNSFFPDLLMPKIFGGFVNGKWSNDNYVTSPWK